MTLYHILNGDSLKYQFPKSITGKLIVARECLVDGDIQGNTLKEFYLNRSNFLSESYGGTTQDYFDEVVTEFSKITELTRDSVINLWFEEDLFCQVNFWFVIHFLQQETSIRRIYLVLPNNQNRYGFGGMNSDELIESYDNKQLIEESDFEELSHLWGLYQNNQLDQLKSASIKLKSKFPFLLTAVEAHIDRIPINGKIGRPESSLLAIMKELKTKDFPTVFREFCKREAVYGFGDLQVKRLFDSLI